MSTARKVRDRGSLGVMLIGLCVFLYQMIDFLNDHTAAAIDYYGTPAGVGEVLTAALAGCVAMLGALGIDIPSLVKGFTQKEK